MKNAADLSSVIHRVDLSRSEKKVPETLRSFVSENMNLSSDPSSGLKLSSASPMSYGIMKTSGRWLVAFGVFLILCGLAGFLSNPSGAKTALISGGTFGALSAAWGLLMLRGFAWAWMAALGCTGFLAAVFTWRAAAGWMAYSAGEPKLFAASLISLMLAGSLVSIGVLVKNR